MINSIQNYLRPSRGFTSLLQLTTPLAIWYAVTLNLTMIWWGGAMLIMSFVYILVGNNIGLHRYFTHKHFEVSRPIEWFFLWSGAMSGLGSPLSYAMVHIVHHRYPDSKLDPHGPIRGIKSWLVWFQKPVDVTETPVFSRRLIELDQKYWWLHRYYVLFVLINALIFYVIDFRLFLMGWLIPAGLTCWIVAWSVWRQHIGLKPNNTPIHRWDIFAEGLHKNHHDWPMAPNTAVRDREIDWTYQASRVFKPRYNWKGQPKKM